MHVQEVTATSNCNPFCSVSERAFIHCNEAFLYQQKIRRANFPDSSLRIFLYIISDIFIYYSIDPWILLYPVLFTDISQTATLTMWLCSRCADFPSMPHQSVTEITSLFRWNDLP